MAALVATRSPLVASLLRQQRDADGDEHVLVGCSLPPKVSGIPRGAVLLSVPRILSSVAAEIVAENEELGRAVLPRVALVRVRWWGEGKPGSTLFRPKVVAQDASRRRDDDEQKQDDGDNDEGDSSLWMRYPVCVPAQQLLDYLRDMKELVLDVIDRESRKKIGRGVFPFAFDDAAPSSPVDMMKKLCRTDALCEIHAAAAPHGVLGYLTVNFEIEWTSAASSPAEALSTSLKWASSGNPTPAINVNPAIRPSRIGIPQEPERHVQQRLSFSSISSSSSSSSIALQESQAKHTHQSSTADRKTVSKATRPAVGSGRLEVLLEKGRALQRSMSVATKTEPIVPSVVKESIVAGVRQDSAAVSSSALMSTAALLASYEAMTEEVDNDWEHVLAQAEESKSTPGVKETRGQAAASMRGQLDSIPISLGACTALEISFETMELEQDTIERLKKLREGSVTTRFSPIQLVVSHEDPRIAFGGTEPDAQDKWIAAFAVNSSLRKRQWRTNYSHTLPLVSRDDDVGGGRVQRALRFRVRCEPQHASPTGKRRRDARQRLDLWTEVPVRELLENRERGPVMSLPLRLAEDSQPDSKAPSSIKRKRHPVGSISVKFRFCSLQSNDGDDLDRESKSEGSISSGWSLDRGSDGNAGQLRTTPSPKRLRSPLLVPRRPGDINGSLFFALLIDRATIRLSAELEESLRGLIGSDKTSRLFLRLDYSTPAFFGRAAKALRLKRSAKARLRRCENGEMQAKVNHMNAFPIDVSDEFVEKLHAGLLILEVWLQEKSKTLTSFLTEKLLGVIKIPLRNFSPLLRDTKRLSERLQHSTPIIGVDQEFPVIDPLTDDVNGQIQVRVGLGTAEHLFHYKSTLAAVVKLQSHVRGWLTRREMDYWKQFGLLNVGDDDDSREGDVQAQSDGFDASDASSSTKKPETEHGLEFSGEETSVMPAGSVLLPEPSQPIIRVKIQVEICESYGRENRDVIGCEVYGLLRIQDEHAIAALLNSSGPRFTLWWDAQDIGLNSNFVHSFQASDPLAGIHLHDMALLFRVEPQFAMTHRVGEDNGTVPKGVAAIDLAELVSSHGRQSAVQNGEETTMQLDVDVPIEWSDSAEADGQQAYATRLPLRIALQLSRGSVHTYEPNGLTLTSESSHLELPPERVMTLQTVSRTERLLPATLQICLDIQRVSDVKELVLARLAAAERDAKDSQVEELLRRAMGIGAVKTTVMMSLCLGTELHPAEGDQDQRDVTVTQDGHGQWIKQFRFDDIELQLRDGVQSLPSITQGEADVMVHPELVAFLQEGSLQLQLVLNDDESATLGTVSIPLAPILFRPSGVQGSFPVHVHDDVLSGRIGVHLYVEQEKSGDIAAPDAIAAQSEEMSEGSVSSAPSPRESLSGGSVMLSMADDREDEAAKEDAADEEDHEEWFSEQSVSEAVGSMHKTSRSIDSRLARMKSQSLHADVTSTEPEPTIIPDKHVVEDEPNEATCSTAVDISHVMRSEEVAEELEDDAVGGSSELRLSASDSHSSDHDLNEAESVEALADCASQQEETDEDAEEGSFYKPITLESFGISELEMSPADEPSPPPLTFESTAHMPASPGFGLDEVDGLRQELDELSETETSAIDGSEPAELEFDGDDDDDSIDLSQLEIGSHGGGQTHERSEMCLDDASMPSAPTSPRDELLDSSCETSQNPDELVLPDSVESDEPNTCIADETEAPPSSPSEVEPENPKESFDVETEAVTSMLCAEELHREVSDVGIDADSMVADDANGDDVREREIDGADDATTSHDSQTNEDFLQEDRGDVDMTPEAASGAATVDDSTEVEYAASGDSRALLEVCDGATQTEGQDGSEGVDPPQVKAFDASASAGADVEARVHIHAAVDSACQTGGDRMDQFDGVATSRDLPVDTNDAPECAVMDIRTQQLALPAEKLNLAWQLLNEIRSLYVDTGVGPPQEVQQSPNVLDESVGYSARANVEEDDREETVQLVDTERTVQAPEPVVGMEEGSSKPTEVLVGIEEAKREDTGSIWEWRDEQSLRAEVDERLRQSKHEYEAALALSQSVHSVKSWSSSFGDAERRQQAEQIAIDLSASALERRARNTRAKLFRVDTETERIARIMQGSLSYWVREGEDNDEDDDDGSPSDDDAEDGFGYF